MGELSRSRERALAGVFVFGLIAGVVGLVALVAFLSWKRRHDDEMLVATFEVTRDMARATLPETQIASLTHELAEFLRLEKQAVQSGASAKVARRMSMKASIRSMNAAMELNRIMPG